MAPYDKPGVSIKREVAKPEIPRKMNKMDSENLSTIAISSAFALSVMYLILQIVDKILDIVKKIEEILRGKKDLVVRDRPEPGANDTKTETDSPERLSKEHVGWPMRFMFGFLGGLAAAILVIAPSGKVNVPGWTLVDYLAYSLSILAVFVIPAAFICVIFPRRMPTRRSCFFVAGGLVLVSHAIVPPALAWLCNRPVWP
jgi:hypothetical protein